MNITPASAHPQTRLVKESPIEDFYQRLDFEKYQENTSGDRQCRPPGEKGWIFQ
jgi:hypothetical protein